MSTIKKIVKKNILIILIALVIALALVAGYFYKKSTSGSEQESVAEARMLVRKVGKLMVLPEGETPTIATVSDPEALRSQEFFIGAKLGDKVLIYSVAKKAILYDPKANKIVTIAPLNIEGGTDTEQTKDE